jgi:Tfp pilus assembly protein PilO
MSIGRSKRFYFGALAFFIFLAVATLSLEVWGYTANSNIKSMIDETTYRLTKVADEGSTLATMTKNYEKAIKFETYINTALPDQKDASALISDLNSLASSSGMKLVVVQTNTYTKAKTASLDPSMLQTVKGKYSYELPLSIEVVGTYNNYISFVQKLENYQRLVNITTIDIEKSQEKDAPADQIDVKFNLTAYIK